MCQSAKHICYRDVEHNIEFVSCNYLRKGSNKTTQHFRLQHESLVDLFGRFNYLLVRERAERDQKEKTNDKVFMPPYIL